MARSTIRHNLSATSFPLISALSGRAIIAQRYDKNYIPAISSKVDPDKDYGAAQAIYMHNVMPTFSGYQSITYKETTTAVEPQILAGVNATEFREIIPLRQSYPAETAYLGVTSVGLTFVAKSPDFVWEAKLGIATGSLGFEPITYAFVDGITYLYLAKNGCYTYDFGTEVFSEVVLEGLDVASTLGIFPTLGRLGAWSADTIAWSSLVSVLDFEPSLETGAGSGKLQSAEGAIIAVKPFSVGFTVFCEDNSIIALGSNNNNYPYNFTALSGSGGVADSALVTEGSNSGSQFAYTTSGLQAFTVDQVRPILSEVTDFLSGAMLEDFDIITNKLVIIKLTTTMKKRLTLISDRYLVISYGAESLTHALVYDLVQARWGKLRINHVTCFEHSLQEAEASETPRDSMAFLGADGTISLVDFRLNPLIFLAAAGGFGVQDLNLDPRGSSVLLFGKIQFARSRLSMLTEIVAEDIPAKGFELLSWASMGELRDGTFLPMYTSTNLGGSATFLGDKVGHFHVLAFKGQFNLTTILTSTVNAGRS